MRNTKQLSNHMDLALVIFLISLAFLLIFFITPIICLLKLSPESSATLIGALAGALISGAALLLGNWINRQNKRKEDKEAIKQQRKENKKILRQRQTNLKTLITAELINIATGYIGAMKIVNAAIKQENLSGSPIKISVDNLAGHLPRKMIFTLQMGTEILLLEQAAINSITTLCSNLAWTQEEISKGQFASYLLNILRQDITILISAFKNLKPDQKLQLPGEEEDLIINILNRCLTTKS